MTAADEASCRGESPKRAVLAEIVKARVARARGDALKLNHAGDFSAARARIDDEVAAVDELRVDLPEAKADLEALRADAEALAVPMAVMASKTMHYESYKARRSRGDPHA